jgi:hypothetical protein
MKELGADVHRDAAPPIIEPVRVAVTADLGPGFEQVHVVGAREEVGRCHSPGAGADDRYAASIRSRPRGGSPARRDRRASDSPPGHHRAGPERYRSHRVPDELAAGDRA